MLWCGLGCDGTSMPSNVNWRGPPGRSCCWAAGATPLAPRALAKFLMATIWGVRVLGGTGAGADDVRMVLDQALAVLDA
ncbi:MAG: hypothetical protein H6962_12445 [Chromatiaceae bacterium]|nr:hypothetical protein [Chromatiaceae bacterium]